MALALAVSPSLTIGVMDRHGEARNVSVLVRAPGGGVATLYADATKAATVANPTETDPTGELRFWSDEPGEYTLEITDGSSTYERTVQAYPQAAEVADRPYVAGAVAGVAAFVAGSIDAEAEARVEGDAQKLAKASNLADLANAAAARSNLGLGTAATANTTAFDAAGTATAAVAELRNDTTGGTGATERLLIEWTVAEAFELTAITYNAVTGIESSADGVWPDGSAGVLTVDVVDEDWGTVDAFHVTHVVSGKTVTQAAVTRDPNTGQVTVQPALVVA